MARKRFERKIAMGSVFIHDDKGFTENLGATALNVSAASNLSGKSLRNWVEVYFSNVHALEMFEARELLNGRSPGLSKHRRQPKLLLIQLQ